LITLIVRPSARRRAMSAIEEQIDSSCTVPHLPPGSHLCKWRAAVVAGWSLR
jgi:hypothetical protein